MKIFRTQLRSSALAAALLLAWLAASAQTARFQLQSIALEGNSLVAEADWRAAAAPWLGREIGFEELQAARAAIEALFHARGYRLVTVRLPAQTVDGGVIRMQVVEPVIGQVAIEGQTDESIARWRARLPALADGQSPNLADLDRQLALLAEHPSRRAVVAFSPQLTAPSGTSPRPNALIATIRTQQNPDASWTAFIDNSGNKTTGHLRYGLAFRHANLWGADHQLNAQIVSAPHDESDPDKLSLLPSSKVKIFGASYRIPLPSQAAAIEATLGYSSVDSGTLAGLFDIKGTGNTYALKYTQHLARWGAWQPRWSIGMDWRHYDNQVLFGGVNLAVPIGVRPLTLGLQASRPAAPGDESSYAAYAQVVANVSGGKDGDTPNFIASRAGSLPAYRLFRYGMEGQWSLSGALQGWSLSGRLDGQLTNELLASPEQFSAGGASSVRGFSSRGIGGDAGVRSQWELMGRNWLESTEASLRPAVFIDAAYAKTNQPTVLERPSSSIAGAGLGLRGAWKNTVWRLDVAKAVHQRTGATPVWGAVHFSLSAAF
jgi:hemolysin activation/secretion protein